jgi:hypothetical protein
VFTAPHKDRAAAHLCGALNRLKSLIEKLERVEIDAFPTAFVTYLPISENASRWD